MRFSGIGKEGNGHLVVRMFKTSGETCWWELLESSFVRNLAKALFPLDITVGGPAKLVLEFDNKSGQPGKLKNNCPSTRITYETNIKY